MTRAAGLLRILAGLLVALLCASPAGAGVVAHADTFQYGVKPDANFLGCADNRLLSTSPERNSGASISVTIGFTASGSAVGRGWFKWTPGAYLPSWAFVDSAFFDFYGAYATGTDADTALAYFCLKPTEEGTGLGGTAETDSIDGGSWQAWLNAATGGTDSTWNVAGADSAAAGHLARWTYTLPEQAAVGADSTDWIYDRTPYPFAAVRYPNTTGWNSMNFTVAVRAWLRGDVPNYGWFLRDANEAAGKWVIISKENTTAANRWKMRVYWHDPRVRSHLGPGGGLE